MKSDDKVSLLLSILAYTNGTWPYEDVIAFYEYVKNEVGSAKIKLVKGDIEDFINH